MIHSILRTLATAAVLVVAQPSWAETNLSSSIDLLAEDKPWTVKLFDGRRGEMEFRADGSVTLVRGAMQITGTWALGEDELCIDLIVPIQHCVTLEPTELGYLGFSGELIAFALER